MREQQERGRNFQANAVALLGFDGVVLGILASNNFLLAGSYLTARTVFGVLAVLALAVSAFAAVRVITPRGTGSVVIDDTLDAWQDLHHKEGAKVLAFQHFAHMLLARDPAPTTSASSEARWWRRRTGQPQVLHQAAELAKFRSRWTTASAVALLSALAALVAVILVPLFDSDGGTPSQAPSPSITTQR